MTALKYIVGAGDHRCPGTVDMTALKYIPRRAVLPWSAKTIVYIYIYGLPGVKYGSHVKRVLREVGRKKGQ